MSKYCTSCKLSLGEQAANLALGVRLRSYRFDKYLTTEGADKKPSLSKLAVMVNGVAAARRAYGPLEAVADGVDVTRDLVSEPGNVIYPKTLADACRKLTKLGVKVEVLSEKQMEKLGMGALLGVGMGSERESQLVVMQWNGGAKSKKPVALVGKGVTFDTGGISIKPSSAMDEMKYDKAGACTVLGAVQAIAELGCGSG